MHIQTFYLPDGDREIWFQRRKFSSNFQIEIIHFRYVIHPYQFLWIEKDHLLIQFIISFFSGDVLRMVLSIYHGGPLPTHEEVLVCTKETSVEEVFIIDTCSC